MAARFTDTNDTAKMGAEILTMDADERDKLARSAWGRPWMPGNDEPYAERLAEDTKRFCDDHSLDVETYVADVAKLDVGEITVA